MIREHRLIVTVVLIALTMLGVGAGAKLAQLEDEQLRSTANIARESAAKTAALAADEDFYVKNEKPPAKVVQKPVVPVKPVDPDGITAESYMVGDLTSGQVIFEKNSDKILPFASMSKFITALIATNIYASTAKITIHEEATKVSPDASGLRAGEIFTVAELLQPLLMNSSNVAGEALASSNDRAAFLQLMSDYSWEVGMPQSNLADPTGLGASNSGTARGFFGLARYLYRERPDILAFTRIASSSVATTTEHGSHIFSNIHPFVRDSRFLGGKTGHTDIARDTMLTILDMAGRPVAFIVLRSDNRTRDTQLLIEKFMKGR